MLLQGGKSLPAAANWYAPSCDVTGPLVTAETLEELTAAEISGRIVLLHGALTQGDVAPRGSVVYYPEEHRRLNDLLDARPPAAVISVAMRVGSLRRVFSDVQMPSPSVTVPAEVGAHLLRHRDVPVSLRIRSEVTPGQGWNVIGERPGRRPERVVVSAHYDTVLDTPGAIDNASGSPPCWPSQSCCRRRAWTARWSARPLAQRSAGGTACTRISSPLACNRSPRPGDRMWARSALYGCPSWRTSIWTGSASFWGSPTSA